MIFGWCNSRLPMNFLPCARSWLAQLCAIVWKYNLQFFLKQNAERVLRWEKLKLYLSKWHAVQWDPWCLWDSRSLNLFWISAWFNISAFIWIVYLFVEFIEQLNKEPFWLKRFRLIRFALPPSPVCLLCSVLSTGTFAVTIACTSPSGLLGS